jgi:hypothetical protein
MLPVSIVPFYSVELRVALALFLAKLIFFIRVDVGVIIEDNRAYLVSK